MELFNNFNKKFSFKNENYELPAADNFFKVEVKEAEKHEPLQTIKRILNFVKSKLNDYKIEEWSEHTKRRNPAQQIVFHLKNSIKAEFVTQAFAKFYECISSYPMVDENLEDKFFSVHLCEAPGAFITALNHYLKLNHPETEFVWRATTLNPYYEGNSISNTILDDRLILHTLPNWFFGETHNGDILDVNNIRSLVAYCKSIGNVHLVTCDGSIDCLEKPENQEEHVSKLHMAEFVTSLALLAEGGSILLKLFTFYEVSTVAMLYILNCCFNQVHIFKPATSKEGNSEVYVIGIGYNRTLMTDEHLTRLIDGFNAHDKVLLPLSQIPPDFMSQVTNAARFFMNLQVSVIENNIRSFRKYDKREYDRIKWIKYQMVEEYMRIYKVSPIDENKKLLHGAQLNTDVNLNERVHRGSHSERILFKNLERADQITVLYDRLKHFYDSILNHVFVIKNEPICIGPTENIQNFIKIIRGAPIRKVLSSKFVLVSILKYFNELRDFVEESPDVLHQNVNISPNYISFDIEYFRSVDYDTYGKDVAKSILQHILKTAPYELTIDGLPLLTQFLVGVTLYLASYVYMQVHLDRSTAQIIFTHLRDDGLVNLKYLVDVIDQNITKGIIGICDTKMLFTCNNLFYKSIIDYNNQLCIRFCSHFLKNISK